MREASKPGTPPVTTAAIGRLLAPVVGYVRRKDAVRQASMWNDVLRSEAPRGEDPVAVVEVSERGADGLWRLAWRDRQS